MKSDGEVGVRGRLRIVTLNAWCPSVFGLYRAARIGERLQLIVRELERLQPDLVCFQEMWDRQAIGVLSQLEGFEVVRPPHRPWFKPLDSGLLTLSRLKVESQAFYPLGRATRLKETVAAKGLHVTRHTLPTEREVVCVMNVHNGVHGPERRRRRQAEHIAEIADTLPGKAIVTGDLNADSRKHYREDWTPMQRLLDLGYLDAAAEHLAPGVHPRENRAAHEQLTFSSENGNHRSPIREGRIDYIFLRGFDAGALQAARRCFHEPVDGLHASDHFGVCVDVEL
jgi:endonuclease/exonuclease/phosphatase family metal-dependent hydrolase